MNKRRFMKRNEGYSLVEMIIVIAIIAVMTAAAMVTLTIMHNAKAKEAASTLEDALSQTQGYAKGKMVVIGGTNQPDYRFALAIHKQGDRYYVKKGYYKGNGSDMNQYSSYEFPDSENACKGKGESFSAYVTVKYVDDTGTEYDVGELSQSGAPVYIIYDRQGMCIKGNGKFRFYKKSGDSLISTVTLNKNGSHTSN